MKFTLQHYSCALSALLLVTFSGCATVGIGSATTISSADTPKSIPDGSMGGVSSTLEATALNITDVNVIIDEIRHGNVSDLDIELISPQGTRVILLQSRRRRGALSSHETSVNFIGTILDDQSPATLDNAVAPYHGVYSLSHKTVGESPLAAFNGENAEGSWRLNLTDTSFGDAGELIGWRLQFNKTPAR